MASLDDIFTTSKNIVSALYNSAQSALSIVGEKNSLAITTDAVVLAVPGRVVLISVIDAGSADGYVYDASTVATAVDARKIAVIPQVAGPFSLNMAVAYGIVVKPGTGQVIAVGYS